ncbi:aromatic aminotransferase [Fusarium tjaetaba]|uniref:Aromatic aminotransferase n=1 Tax=Fusarium tjaetaba TaxID=1567544 RepID=A0A8H5QYI4_9HYPO|nr:aromatic aminotransferase [Fusarium tjaetaba]KAF5623264.1 aromatic aminotransferase [Fusarium tjaetaba]
MTTLSSAHLCSFPEETIDRICQQLCPCCSEDPSPRYFLRSKWPNPAGDRNCLLALSLTCQKFRRVSQPHLYHRPIGHDFLGFINTIDGTPALGKNVKELYVNLDVMESLRVRYLDQFINRTEYSRARRQLLVDALDSFMPVLLSLTPMLTKLEVYFGCDRQFSSTPSRCLLNLKELSITFPGALNLYYYEGVDGVAGLLRAAPLLERIHMSNFGTRMPGFYHDNVNEITLTSFLISIDEMKTMMRRFPKLQTFRISTPYFWQNLSQGLGTTYKIEDVLMLRSNTLKHVALELPGHGVDGKLVIQDLSGMKALETLYIDSGMLHRRWEQGHQPAPRICHMLPKSIKEFGLMGSAYPLVHEEVVESINISAQAFPHLKKVFVAQFQEEWPEEWVEWESKYASACEAHNIELSSWLPPSLQSLMSQWPNWD